MYCGINIMILKNFIDIALPFNGWTLIAPVPEWKGGEDEKKIVYFSFFLNWYKPDVSEDRHLRGVYRLPG